VRFHFAFLCLAAGAACTRAPSVAPAPDTSHKDEPHFYHRMSVGSEVQFNPASQIVNEGFDVLRTTSQDRHVFRRNFRVGANIVWRSAMHPNATFSYYGYHNALVNEWLPLSYAAGRGGAAWVPNYEYHLLGSGMVAARMTEWFEQHDAPVPELLSAATLMTSHFVNEVVENGLSVVPNEDATTDLLIFDMGGILLWHFDAVQRLFSGPVQLTNWPGQPSIDIPSGTLENAGQQFVLKAPLPFTRRWKVFYDFGMTSLLGASRQFSNGDALSAGFGADAVDNPVVDSRTGAKTATLRFKTGVFYDRRGSLLWSVQAGSRSDIAVVNVNVYPGLLGVGTVKPGFWLQVPRTGGVRFGLASSWGLGMGYGPER
jgi:hypothetical protein